MNCREALEQVYLYLDGEVLSEGERQTLEVHLKECIPCFERAGLEQEVTALVQRLRGSDPCPDGLKSKIVTLLQQA